jgi:CubicO group peptidase (beta-lactamase class C family)
VNAAKGFFDLASLAKPLVTAPLALARLELDQDRRDQLGFQDRVEPLTVRQLLSHSAGLPPWLPFTGEKLPEQLRRGFPVGAHALLRTASVGVSTYSDLGYRLLGELLEQEAGKPFQDLGATASGLLPAPWEIAPAGLPDGPDAAAWALAAPGVPFPERSPVLPQDANARAGMRGHAGFGATPRQMEQCLQHWIQGGLPSRMAVDTAGAEDGTRWGLGLQRSLGGLGRFGHLLERLPAGFGGLHVLVTESTERASPAPEAEPRTGTATAWWMHFGFTGPALFVRPEDGACICLLVNRRGPSGELLDLGALQARRWALLEGFCAEWC